MNDKPTINPQTLPVLTKFIYTIGELPTSYLMSMTYEEQVVWLCNYLETQIIPALNQNGEAVRELQNLYELLRTYVNDYFENLDVQEEINNKLDEMYESGQLDYLFARYITPIQEEITQTLIDQNSNITEFENQINSSINALNIKVANATSGSPLVASSTSEMTQEDRIYVNTTDGKWYYYDGDSWEIGGTYQATEDSDTIDYILFELIPSIHGNQFDVDSATTGKYLAGLAGNETEDSRYGHSDYIEFIGDSSNYVFSSFLNDSACWCYNEAKEVVGHYQTISYFLTNGFNEGTKYIRFNFGVARLNSIKVYRNSSEAEIELPYGSKKLDSANIYNSTIPEPIDIYVGETRLYTTLNEALDYANNTASKLHPVNIHIDNGTYNVFTSSILEEAPARFTGLVLNDYVNIYGACMEKTIIQGELPVDISSYAFTRNNVSTLNAWKNNIIKDCTIVSKNMRYSLHNDDYKSNAVPNAQQTFENVIFKTLAHDTGVSNISKMPVGIGAYNGRNTKFINCVFDNEDNGTYSIILHNNTSSPVACNWIFDNCDILNEGSYSMGVSSAGSNQEEMIQIKGCKLNKNINFYNQNVYQGTESEFTLRGYSNEIPGYTWSEPLIEDDSKIRMID